MSVDIDLFTDAIYGSVDFNAIDHFLQTHFAYTDSQSDVLPAMGKSYFVGPAKNDVVKLDVYYSNDSFIQPVHEFAGVRMATVEEIIAMKIDVVSRGGRKKDFWDLHEIMPQYSIPQMLALHRQRHEWTHDQEQILLNMEDFKKADEDFNPRCLRGKTWEFIKDDIVEAVKNCFL
jgi:hypothetical protein